MANQLYSEEDTKAKFIDIWLKQSEWTESEIAREYQITDGRKLIGGKRAKPLFADYLLKYKNLNLAIVEAKKYKAGLTKGLEQVKNYGQKLKLRWVYTTDGTGIYEFDLHEGKGKVIDTFPSPEELYKRYIGESEKQKQQLFEQNFHLTGAYRPRYYQEIAVNSVMSSIADQQNRILLTLATGTGKTFIAFQIVHKLLQQAWNKDGDRRRPRILFLADRNILVDQAMNTFNPYEKDLVKINGGEIRKRNGQVPTNAHIFFAIYQAISDKEEFEGFYKQYPTDFFDLIIIDECHRGSANEDGSWRDILDYFSNSVHLGLTATPKRSDNVDTYNYFGKPVYEYSLKDGIHDGFLTPYKVKRIKTNIDEYIYTSEDTVVEGDIDEKNIYEIKDFNRSIVIAKREQLIAKAMLDNIRPMDKTIVFCQDQAHARMIRDYINEYKQIRDPDYCVAVTSDEGPTGRNYLESFQNNDLDIPTILTSSQMLTTGVDARNVRNIVLVRTIGSMVEFKQIIGRGTRVYEGKDFFTIIDFTGATQLFYDDEWDGLPEEEPAEIQVNESELEDKFRPANEKDKEDYLDIEEEKEKYNLADYGLDDEDKPKEKVIVKLSDGRQLKVTDIETRYINIDGRPLSSKEFLEKLIGCIPLVIKDEKQFREWWASPAKRNELLKYLADKGFDSEQLDSLRIMFNANDCDLFDVLSYIAFNKDMHTRKQRVKSVNQSSALDVYENVTARSFLEFILERYVIDGVETLGRDKLGELIKLNKIGTTKEAKKAFGSNDKIIEAFNHLQKEIYRI